MCLKALAEDALDAKATMRAEDKALRVGVRVGLIVKLRCMHMPHWEELEPRVRTLWLDR